MSKKIFALVAILVLSIFLLGCGQKQSDNDFEEETDDADDTFNEELEDIDEDLDTEDFDDSGDELDDLNNLDY